jgi:hypothetical protein
MQLVVAGTSSPNAAEGIAAMIKRSAAAVKGDNQWPQILQMIENFRALNAADIQERVEKLKNRDRY